MGIFATGVVYGCNPDALFCVIPAITLPTKLAAATYTAMFVLGTVGAMGGYTAFIGQPSHLRQLCAVLCCAVLCCVDNTTCHESAQHTIDVIGMDLPFGTRTANSTHRLQLCAVIAIVKALVSSKLREQGGACRCCLKKRV